MANVKIRKAAELDTPSQQIVNTARKTAEAIDKKGRVIEVQVLRALDLYRLTKIMGVSSQNETTMNLAMTARSVVAIDGVQISAPSAESEIEAIIQQLDFDGLQAAGEALKALGNASTSSDELIEQTKN